jgi:hypothetical protein
MRQLFEDLLPTALRCGITVLEFWEYTIGELILIIGQFGIREKERLQERAGFNYSLANLIGLSVARLMDKEAKYPPIHEVYPTLFDGVIQVAPAEEDWRIAKDRLMRYANAHNKKQEVVNE